jgi:hypothetical protein
MRAAMSAARAARPTRSADATATRKRPVAFFMGGANLRQDSRAARSRNFCNLPVGVRGSASAKT